jgi:RND family efflux transporter MFP subunit
VTQAQENVDSAHAGLVAAKAEVNLDAVKMADVNDARAQMRQAMSALQTAQANTAQDVLKMQDVEQAKEAVSVAQDQVTYNKAQVDKTFIRSPISGTVLQLAAQQGETLAAGLSAPTLIVVADLNRLQVDAYVDETDIGKVKLGQEADITVDAFPKKVFKGKVSKIASGSTIQQGVITYDVTVALNNVRSQLKPDMTANVTVQTGKRENVLLVPTEAVKGGVRGSTVTVMTRANNHTTVESRKVKTGGTDGVNTEIQDGLQEGDTVVLAGMTNSSRPNRGAANGFGPGGGAGGGRGGR